VLVWEVEQQLKLFLVDTFIGRSYDIGEAYVNFPDAYAQNCVQDKLRKGRVLHECSLVSLDEFVEIRYESIVAFLIQQREI